MGYQSPPKLSSICTDLIRSKASALPYILYYLAGKFYRNIPDTILSGRKSLREMRTQLIHGCNQNVMISVVPRYKFMERRVKGGGVW